MKIAILSVLFCRYPLDRTFEAVARMGYDGLDLWGGRPHAYPYDMDGRRIDEVLRLKDKYGLEIPTYTPELLAYPYNIASPDAIERTETLRYLTRAIDVAAALDIPRMQITCGHAGYNTTRAQNHANIYEVLGPLVEKAEKDKVTILLEPLTSMESNTAAFVDDIAEILDRFDSPYLKTMMDTVTPKVNREVYAEHFEKLGKKLDYIHFVDSNGVDEAHMLLGKGIIDLPGLIDIIRRYHYDGWLCIEIIGKYIHEPETFASGELRALKALLSV